MDAPVLLLNKTPATLAVYINGVRTLEYTLTGNTVEILTAVLEGDIINIDYFTLE